MIYEKVSLEGLGLAPDANEWEAVGDTRTGLMWAVECKLVERYDFAELAASQYAAGGFRDWRMPTLPELQTLIDLSRFAPAIDRDFFPRTPANWFWTSTLVIGNPRVQWWAVSFHSGSTCPQLGCYPGYVRGVRAA